MKKAKRSTRQELEAIVANTTSVSLGNHFYIQNEVGPVHVNMNPNAGAETFKALNKMVKLAYNKL